MLRRSWTVCAMTALLLGGSAAAQSPGTLLVGGFGTWTHFDSKWDLDTGFGNSWGTVVGSVLSSLRTGTSKPTVSYTPAQAAAGTRFLGSGTAFPAEM